MFTCTSLQSGEKVNILTFEWRKQLNYLRRLDSDNRLVCQGCKQPVRVKAGKTKRWHFAHKHLHNCAFGKISPELMAAQSAMYDWLVGLFGESVVELEVLLPDLHLPKPIDIVIEVDQKRMAFWIVETRLNPAIREIVWAGLNKLKFPFIITFLNSMQRKIFDQEGVVSLSTTERDFAQFSEYDLIHHPIGKPSGKSIHYFDVSVMKITTYRDLECIHKPQIYRGRFLQTAINNVQVDVSRGTFVHPRESTELRSVLSRIKHRNKKLEDSRKIFGRVLNRMLPNNDSKNHGKGDRDEKLVQDFDKPITPVASQKMLNEPAKCMYCGQTTEDWWYLDRLSGLCKCRSCLRSN